MSTALGPYSRTNNFVFDPSQISGLSLWLDAADDSTVIRTGVNITRWDDKSGNRRNVTASGTPTYVANSLGGLNAINFATSASFFTTPSFALTSSGSFTMFFIYNFVSAVAGNTDFFITPSSYAIFDLFVHTSGTQRLQLHLDSLTPLSTSLIPTRGVPYIYAVNYNYTSGALNVFANGSNIATNTRTTNLLATPQTYTYGAQSSNAFYYESVIYNNSLTTTQQQQVESYLAWKWNLQRNLPTTHPYYNSPYVAYNQYVNIPQQIIDTNTVFPNQISGLALWLDAADDATVIRTGSAVTRWNDKSGNIRNLTTVLSGVGTITYSNVSLVFSNTAYMFINTPVNLQNFTVFFIGKTLVTSGTANNQMIFCGRPTSGFSYNATDGLGLYYDYTATKQTRFYGSSINPIQDAVTFVDPVLNCYTQNAAGSLSSFLYGSNTSNIATTARTTTTQGFAVGAEASSSTGYSVSSANNFQMNEVIVYNSVLTTTQRQQIEGYLAYKWNLKSNLPLTHPTYTPPFVPSGSISVKPYILLPSQFSGLALWLDAADSNTIVLSGSNVSQWNDKSGNARHMSNATLANTPTYNPIGFKNLPTISFSPSIFNFLQNTSFNLNSLPSITLFIIVQRISNTINYQRFFSASTTIGGGDQNSTTVFNLNTSSANDGILYERNNVYSTKAIFNTLNPCMIELIINGSSTNIDIFLGNNNYIYTNGSLGTSSTGSGNGTNFNLVHVRLGNATYVNSLISSEQLQGNISEIVMFNKALNLNEFRQTERV